MNTGKKNLSKKEQKKIVNNIDTAKLPNNMGFPKGMSGVTLNLETGKYE